MAKIEQKQVLMIGVGLAIVGAAIAAYFLLKSGNKLNPATNSKKQLTADAKKVAALKQTAAANPNSVKDQLAYQAGLKLLTAGSDYLNKTINKDGTPRKKITSPDNTPAVTVDRNGSYLESNEPTTLYNSDGSVKGDLDSDSGMFVDAHGNIVASQDGTPVTLDQYGNYTEPDGSVYAPDGTEIKINADGTYTDLSDNNIYNMDGTPVQDDATNTSTNINSPSYDPSDINSPNYDPTLDPNSSLFGH